MPNLIFPEDHKLRRGFLFGVSIGTSHDEIPFQEVRGLTKEVTTEKVNSGGENRFSYQLPGRVSHENLVLQRGVAPKMSPFSVWCARLFANDYGKPITTHDLTVHLHEPDGSSVMTWRFIKAYPIKWVMSDLKSQENILLIETIEFAYRYYSLEVA